MLLSSLPTSAPPEPVTELTADRGRRPAAGDHSLADVLDAIRIDGARSRLEIMERTGLTRAVTTQRIGELVDHGLVTVDGTAPSTGGRPPRQLGFAAGIGSLLVADLGATSIDVALTDLAGAVLAHVAEPADVAEGPESVLTRVEQLFDGILDERRDGPPVWAIGIGVPGPVEFSSGLPVSPPIMPGWDGYPIRDRFTTRYRVPVWVDNDVNVMALGEWRHGIARGHDNVVYVKVGTGIGAGLISDGLPHRGSQGAAGDIGHIQVVADPTVRCRCGNVGCLEAVAGGGAIGAAGERAARDGTSPRLASVLAATGAVTARDVADAARRGDTVAFELLQRAGSDVGATVAGIVNFFNPSLIVLGGGVSHAGDALIAAVREIVYRRSLPLATRDLLIRRTSLGELGGVIGAATMAADELFSRDALPRWIGRGEPAAELGVLARG